jgi:serine/threonine protein kinase
MQERPRDNLDIDDQRLLDRLCEQFESRWRDATETGSDPPAIEDFLKETNEPLRSVLFQKLLLIELELRKASGLALARDEYRGRFSDRAAVVDRFFAGLDVRPDDQRAQERSDRAAPVPDWAEPSTVVGGHASETDDWRPRPKSTAPPNPADRQETSHPERMGRFEVIKTLGAGRFGTVYLAHDEKLKRAVALKVPHREEGGAPSGPDSEWLESVRAEAQKTASLNDPRIVPIYDIQEMDDGRPFIVSKYIAGRDLAARLKAGPIDHTESVGIVEQIARALHHAHLQGLVHRDIKPHNILIEENGQPAVTDFGLAIREEERRQFRGKVAGSPAYMSPEQVRGDTHQVDGRSDIWSLGVVLYELLTGRRPFSAPNVSELLDAIRQDQVKPPRQIDDSVPVELERIILRCLEKDPRSRYTTAKDLADDLQHWAARHTPRPARPKRAVVWSVVAIGAAIVLGLVTWFSRPAPAPLEGSIDLKREFVSAVDQQRRIQTRSQSPTEFRIESGNLVQVNAELNRPCYVYLLWIEADGNVVPVYPWVGFQWTQRPETERPEAKVSRPDGNQGWPVGGPAGIETAVLLARDKPLPSDVDFGQLLAGIPKLGLPTEVRRRGPGKGTIPRAMGAIDDSQRRRLLQSRLQEHFPLIRTVSFANLGEGQPSE